MIVADAIEYINEHGKEYAAIHASFPCQAFCSMKHMPNAKEYADLVTPGREALKATGKPYIIENVVGAPLIRPTMLCGTMFGLGTGDADLRRHRLFETNWPLVLDMGMFCKHGRRAGLSVDADVIIGQAGIADNRALRRGDFKKPKTISVHDSQGRGHDEAHEHEIRRRPASVGVWGNAGGASKRDGLLYFSTAERNEAMGIDWMKGGEISQAIPPTYTHYVGLKLMQFILKSHG
jgi:DNA (cytosine-5)-methyltransferase 1